MTFIKLTSLRSKRMFYVAATDILVIWPEDDHSKLTFRTTGNTLEVKESVKEILDMIAEAS